LSLPQNRTIPLNNHNHDNDNNTAAVIPALEIGRAAGFTNKKTDRNPLRSVVAMMFSIFLLLRDIYHVDFSTARMGYLSTT